MSVLKRRSPLSLFEQHFLLIVFIATMKEFDAITAVNFRGVFLCYQYAAKQMIKEGHGGRIIGELQQFSYWLCLRRVCPILTTIPLGIGASSCAGKEG